MKIVKKLAFIFVIILAMIFTGSCDEKFAYILSIVDEDSTSTGAGDYFPGELVKLEVAPTDGFYFDGWYEGDKKLSDSQKYEFFMPNKDYNLTAKSLPIVVDTKIYELTINSNNGTATGAGGYLAGDSVTVTAAPNSEYRFDGWSDGVNIISTARSYTFNMPNQDYHLQAMYTKIEVKIPLSYTLINNDTEYEVSVGSATLDGFTEIIIPETHRGLPVTKIADYGFCDNYPLNYNAKTDLITSITIPTTITEIGESAFSGMLSLEEINFKAINLNVPAADNTIFNQAGANTNGITLNISKGVTRIPSTLFQPVGYSLKLSSINIEENSQIVILEDNTFKDMTSLESVTFGDESFLISIAERVFEGCTNLTTVNFGNNNRISNINDCVFKDCTSLGYVNFGENSKLARIGISAFENCSSLLAITIPEKVSKISDRAFAGTLSLAEINFEAAKLTNVDSSNKIFFNAGANTNGITINVGKKVTKLPVYLLRPFEDNLKIKTLNFADNSAMTTFEETNFKDFTYLENVFFGANASLSEIKASAFEGCTNLVSFTFPNSITSISAKAFKDCSVLENVLLTEESKLVTIGNNAFENCVKLNAVNLSKVLTTIGESSFAMCSALTEIAIPSKITTIEKSTFEGCTSLSKILFIENSALDIIKAKAFKDCVSVEVINLPVGLTNIETEAFNHCIKLSSIFIPSSVKYFSGDKIFNECGSLINISTDSDTIPTGDGFYVTNTVNVPVKQGNGIIVKSGTEIYPLRVTTNVTSFILPTDTTKIGTSAFQHCTLLASMSIPNTVTSINEQSFHGCTALESINIPDNVTSISTAAFENCSSLANLNVSDNANLQGIGERAFKGCSSITSFTFTSKVNSVGGNLLEGATSIKVLNFYTNEFTSFTSFPQTVLNGAGDSTVGLTVNVGADVQNFHINFFEGVFSIKTTVNFLDNSKFKALPQHHYKYFDDWTCLTNLNFGNNSSFESFGYSYFAFHSNLETVSFGDNSKLTTIGGLAFSNCTSLKSFTLGQNNQLKTIEGSAFYDCPNFTTINFGNNNMLESIGGYAFSKTAISEITIPATVKSIGGDAFTKCYSLKTVTFQNNSQIEAIPDYCFDDCTNLTTINFGTNSGLQIISAFAFSDNISLQSITIPKSVKRIGGFAFAGSYNLVVYIEAGTDTSGWEQAVWNSSVKQVIYL